MKANRQGYLTTAADFGKDRNHILQIDPKVDQLQLLSPEGKCMTTFWELKYIVQTNI